MPYEGEFAHHRSIHRIAENERVKKLLGSYRIRDYSQEASSQKKKYLISIEPSNWIPALVLSIDGSFVPVPIKNGFPGAEAAYITVASVLLDMAKMKELDRHRPVDPRAFQQLEHTGSVDCALPGCNIVYEGESSAKTSLRKALFDIFESERMATESETLLDTYEALLAYKPDTRDQKCPYDDCPIDNVYQPQRGIYTCPCTQARPLYSSDALRIHERMQAAGKNGEIYSEVTQVLEHLWMIHILRYLERKKWLSTLSRLAIIHDGPLAIFGQPAWLSEAIYR